jgi:hypothetical protein
MAVAKNRIAKSKEEPSAKERRELDYMFRRMGEMHRKNVEVFKEIAKLKRETRALLGKLRAA